MIIAFLGPSLRLKRRGVEVWPPARQGDVWRALRKRPRAIALVDGVFESVPSVWHHELLDALDAGVPVFGGASMGALRAAELHTRGMVGVGQVFRWYRDGVLNDDSHVALLHADAEHGFRPLTVPHVNVIWAARSLPARKRRALVKASEEMFYQERTWEALERATGIHVRAPEDLKALDALETVEAALEATPLPVKPREPRASSHVRWRRVQDEPRGDAREGLRTMLIAGFARELGLRPTASEVQRALRRVRAGDADERLRIAEDLALEELALQHAPRILNDGPTQLEASVFANRIKR